MAAECPTSWGGQPMRGAIDRAAPRRRRSPSSATTSLPPAASTNVSNNTNYFVYKAGAAACGAGQPPSLSRLPACDIPMKERDCDCDHEYHVSHHTDCDTEREFRQGNTGILQLRGWSSSSLPPLVAQLQPSFDAPFDTAELCVLCPGSQNWELKTEVPIVHGGEGEERRHDLERWTVTNVTVPIGGRYLCWANYDLATFLVCDMVDAIDNDSPKLHYVPLPVKAMPSLRNDFDEDDYHEKQPRWHYNRTIGAGAGADTVWFVSMDNRCCCGVTVTTSLCAHSSSAFTVTMWSLDLRTNSQMAWVKEAVIDCEEIWALLAASCKGFPRSVQVISPIVSLENPDVVCFVAYHDLQDTNIRDVWEMWTLEIDMRRKTLISVVPYPPHPNRWLHHSIHLPAKLHS
uniref:DUF1618 domain-containing protein n=1 Tax=Leersia perrieri TaxID=77586 RepID=A0A0D9XTC2_9ORYZ